MRKRVIPIAKCGDRRRHWLFHRAGFRSIPRACTRARPYFGSMLPDASCKDDGVEPNRRGDEQTQLPPDPIDEKIDSFFAARRPLVSKVRMSLDKPETPSSPERS